MSKTGKFYDKNWKSDPMNSRKAFSELITEDLYFPQVIEIFHQDHLLGCVRERPIVLFQKKHLQVFSNTEEKIYDINGPPCRCTCSDFVFDVSCDIF